MIVSIAGHSVDEALLDAPGHSGMVLDAGCRDFEFARAMVARGKSVVALDPDPSVTDPGIKGVKFWAAGLSTRTGIDHLVLMENPEMRHLALGAGYAQWRGNPRVEVKTISVADASDHLADDELWDVVKLDIEGSEYEILRQWQPIARQVTVEFHDHMEHRPPAVHEEIFSHLSQWYDVAKNDPQDTLFVLRVPRDQRLP